MCKNTCFRLQPARVDDGIIIGWIFVRYNIKCPSWMAFHKYEGPESCDGHFIKRYWSPIQMNLVPALADFSDLEVPRNPEGNFCLAKD